MMSDKMTKDQALDVIDDVADLVGTSAFDDVKALDLVIAFKKALSQSEPALEHKPDTSLLGSLGKNWTEDASHENGNYTNKCNLCDSMFLGHKRRVICKECAVQLNPPYLLKYRKDPAMLNEDILHKPEVSQEEINIVADWPPCNPACEYEDPNGGIHDLRSASCSCDAAKCSIAKQNIKSEPAQVSQPVAEICSGFALHWVGSGAIAPIIEKHNLKVGDKLFSSPPDYEALKAQLVRSEADNTRLQSQYDEMRLKCSRRPAVAENEALKAENTLLKEVEKSFADLSENLQNDCAALKLRVAELEAATEHLGLTPQQAKDGLSRHKALVAERDRLQSDKANLIQQAEIQAQEARTMKSIVIGILTDLDLPQKDYDARSNIAQKFSRLQSECDSLKLDANRFRELRHITAQETGRTEESFNLEIDEILSMPDEEQ